MSRRSICAALAGLALASCGSPQPAPPARPPVAAVTPKPPAPTSPVRPPVGANPSPAAGYTGSAACAACHRDIYDRWRKTPMANVVRDPKIDRDAILPDLATNTIHPFSRDDVALVYGSIHKQRYFTKRGDDYFPEPAQWDVTHKVWRKYFVETGTDWWTPFYPADTLQRPTGPLCDGCHSVGYDVQTKSVVEWNVGCERCHGPGAAHSAKPTRANIVDPKRLDEGRANDTCIQCHSQGRPVTPPSREHAYDWPVGYQVGTDLRDVWRLEDHKLGETTFTHFADGTAHKNRMQGNDFVQSEMYRHGVTCFSCHDVHGTSNPADLRVPTAEMCSTCHTPGGPNGPRAKTPRGAHPPQGDSSTGSACVACHMPKIETTIADVKVRSHTFSFVTPAETERNGTPNPCTLCHADKTTAWATSVLRRAPGFSAWRME